MDLYIYVLKSVVFAIEIPRLSPFRALHSARSSNVGVLVLVIKKENNNNKQIMLTSYHHTWPLWFQIYVCYSPFRLLSGNRLKVLPRKAIILGFGPYDFGFGDVDSAVMWVRKCCKYKTKRTIPTIEFGSAASKLKLFRVTGLGTQSFNNRVFLDFRF